MLVGTSKKVQKGRSLTQINWKKCWLKQASSHRSLYVNMLGNLRVVLFPNLSSGMIPNPKNTELGYFQAHRMTVSLDKMISLITKRIKWARKGLYGKVIQDSYLSLELQRGEDIQHFYRLNINGSADTITMDATTQKSFRVALDALNSSL